MSHVLDEAKSVHLLATGCFWCREFGLWIFLDFYIYIFARLVMPLSVTVEHLALEMKQRGGRGVTNLTKLSHRIKNQLIVEETDLRGGSVIFQPFRINGKIFSHVLTADIPIAERHSVIRYVNAPQLIVEVLYAPKESDSLCQKVRP
jgi:hypothetical protein